MAKPLSFGFSSARGSIIVAIVVLSFFLGYWVGGDRGGVEKQAESPPSGYSATEAHQHQDEKVMYVCPMMDVPPMEQGGNCPVCGMELVPIVVAQGEDSAPQLKLSPEAVKLAEIQVARVARKSALAEIRLYGTVEYDPAHVSGVTAFMPGLIDRVYVKRTGSFVRWGAPLFSIYSPDLYATQQELLKVMQHVPGLLAYQEGQTFVAREAPIHDRSGAGNPQHRSPEVESALKTLEAIRHKLHLLGLPKRDIDELMKLSEATGIATVYAPIYGQVIEVNATEGSYVNTGTPLFTLADPRYVWARLDAYEMDYPWLRRNQKVSFETSAYPGETFEGQLVNIDPLFQSKTRTFKIGVIASDHGGKLKAGLQVRAVIHAEVGADGKVVNEASRGREMPLVVPASAPLITGKRAVVYVELADAEGTYEGREVILGPKAKDDFVILEGLREGEKVVVNGNFKIDSAIQIHAKSSMMSMKGGGPAAEYQHHGGSQVMHDDYWHERTQSRTLGGAPGGDRSLDMVSPSEPHHDHQSLQGPSGPSKIIRRKPGSYGDSTQQIPLPREP